MTGDPFDILSRITAIPMFLPPLLVMCALLGAVARPVLLEDQRSRR